MNKKINRYDLFDLSMLFGEEFDDEWLYEKFKDTPEGYLKGRAVVTNIGFSLI